MGGPAGSEHSPRFGSQRHRDTQAPSPRQDQDYICTFLHPRRKRFDAVPHEKDLAFDLVKRELLARTSISRITTDTASKTVTTNVSIINDSTAPVNPNNLLACCFDKPRPIVSSVMTSVKELNDYMELIVPDEKSGDILLFWKNHEKSFPTLSELMKPNDDDDDDDDLLYDIEHMHDSKEPDNKFLNL
ncbi:unnamed protein product [Rotaria magnacalcarata]|uniref:HAT C-terminal dimerisation domain-containing protein n=1 Tax=Rotaria magnacalcarata TaxID=392030 RepID=A0A8S2JL41_9BILA|nr:unnamed protein product [Rotaria magnacalcarata]